MGRTLAAGLLALALAMPAGAAATGGTAGATVRFEPNHGQLDPRVRFLARGRAHGLYLTDDGATLALLRPRAKEAGRDRRAAGFDQATLTMRLAGGRRAVPSGSGALPGRSNHFVGRDPARWRTGIESYGRVDYARVRPGVDLVFYGAPEGRLEYDVVLDAGVEPATVALAFEGVESMVVEPGGTLCLRLPGGFEVRQAPPVAYQESAGGERTLVTARYEPRPDGELGFAIGPHDRSRALVIDPTVVYATYLGGASSDVAYAVAGDTNGNAYVTGYTVSANFPSAGTQLPHLGGVDLFVSKLNATGSTLVYSTYLGGSGEDIGLGITVDGGGSVYLTGYTTSIDFPVASALQPSRAGAADVFVAKLGPTGSALVYSTYLGGAADDLGQAIAVDAGGRAYVTGQTSSAGFPRASALQNAFGGARDAFVAKLSATGLALVYATFLGGSQDDLGQGIGLDGAGNAYVGGYTFSTNFPTVAALQATGAASFYADAFVSKLNPAGSALVYSTYLGGSGDEQAYGLGVDAGGGVTIAGYTTSTNLPVVAALQSSFRGGISDGFVSRLNAAGSALTYSSYLGGDGIDLVYGVAVDGGGRAFLTGYTTSTNFPTSVGAPQPALAGGYDAFVTTLGAAGSPPGLSTYLGGAGTDFGLAVAASGASFYVAGQTDSTAFPVRSALQGAAGGSDDAFVVRFSFPSAVPAAGGAKALGLGLGLAAIGGLVLRRRRDRGRTR